MCALSVSWPGAATTGLVQYMSPHLPHVNCPLLRRRSQRRHTVAALFFRPAHTVIQSYTLYMYMYMLFNELILHIVHVHVRHKVNVHVHIYVLMRDEEGRKKEATKVKQTRQSNTAHTCIHVHVCRKYIHVLYMYYTCTCM